LVKESQILTKLGCFISKDIFCVLFINVSVIQIMTKLGCFISKDIFCVLFINVSVIQILTKLGCFLHKNISLCKRLSSLLM
jgi:hypothetical protein